MKGENEMMMMKMNDLRSVQGEMEKVRNELTRIQKDPRHKKRADELRFKLNKLQSTQFRKWNEGAGDL